MGPENISSPLRGGLRWGLYSFFGFSIGILRPPPVLPLRGGGNFE